MPPPMASGGLRRSRSGLAVAVAALLLLVQAVLTARESDPACGERFTACGGGGRLRHARAALCSGRTHLQAAAIEVGREVKMKKVEKCAD